MSIFSNPGKVWVNVKAWFLKKFDKVEDAAEDIWEDVVPALEAIVDAGGKKLLTLAYEAVTYAEAPDKTGKEKFDLAKKHILNGIKDGADDIIDSTVNLAIEVALARLKKAME